MTLRLGPESCIFRAIVGEHLQNFRHEGHKLLLQSFLDEYEFDAHDGSGVNLQGRRSESAGVRTSDRGCKTVSACSP